MQSRRYGCWSKIITVGKKLRELYSQVKTSLTQHFTPFASDEGLTPNAMTRFEEKQPHWISPRLWYAGTMAAGAHISLFFVPNQVGTEKNGGKYHLSPRVYISLVTGAAIVGFITSSIQELRKSELKYFSGFCHTFVMTSFSLYSLSLWFNTIGKIFEDSDSIEDLGLNGESYLYSAATISFLISALLTYMKVDEFFMRQPTREKLLQIAGGDISTQFRLITPTSASFAMSARASVETRQVVRLHSGLHSRTASNQLSRTGRLKNRSKLLHVIPEMMAGVLKSGGATTAFLGPLRLQWPNTFKNPIAEFAVISFGNTLGITSGLLNYFYFGRKSQKIIRGSVESLFALAWLIMLIGPLRACIPDEGTFWSDEYLVNQKSTQEGNTFASPINTLLIFVIGLPMFLAALDMGVERLNIDNFTHLITDFEEASREQRVAAPEHSFCSTGSDEDVIANAEGRILEEYDDEVKDSGGSVSNPGMSFFNQPRERVSSLTLESINSYNRRTSVMLSSKQDPKSPSYLFRRAIPDDFLAADQDDEKQPGLALGRVRSSTAPI